MQADTTKQELPMDLIKELYIYILHSEKKQRVKYCLKKLDHAFGWGLKFAAYVWDL